MNTLESFFLEFHNYQNLQYMYLSPRLKNICQDEFMIIQICIVIKGWDLLNFYGRFCFSALFWQKFLTKKNCFHHKIT